MALVLTRNNSTGWSSLGASQAAFEAVVDRVFSDLSEEMDQGLITTATIDLQFVNIGSGVAGSICQSLVPSTYAAIKALLNSQPTDAIKASAYGFLPASDPAGGLGYLIRGLHNAILTNTVYSGGFLGANDVIQLNSALGAAAYDTTVDGSSCAPGKWGTYQAIRHEVTELGGRWSFLTSPSSKLGILDLFGFDIFGNLNFSFIGDRRLSWDNGSTNLGFMYQQTNGPADAGDWDNLNHTIISPYSVNGITGNPLVPRQDDYRTDALIGWPLSPFGKTKAGLVTNSPQSFSTFQLHK